MAELEKRLSDVIPIAGPVLYTKRNENQSYFNAGSLDFIYGTALKLNLIAQILELGLMAGLSIAPKHTLDFIYSLV